MANMGADIQSYQLSAQEDSDCIIVYAKNTGNEWSPSYFSDCFRKKIKYDDDVVIDANLIQKIIHPMDFDNYQKRLHPGILFNSHSYRIICKDQSILTVSEHFHKIGCNGSEQLIGVVKEKHSTEKLEEELRKMTCAIVQSPVTIMVTDLDGNIEFANPKFTELTGYSFEEVLGKNPRVLNSGLTPLAVYEELWGKLVQEMYGRVSS
jgi:transcriptional regulator with PAS, ATPase and Fis domain